MKIIKYNIRNPDDSEDLGNDARIRFHFSEDDYIEVRWLRETDVLRITKHSIRNSQIIIAPLVSNSVEIR